MWHLFPLVRSLTRKGTHQQVWLPLVGGLSLASLSLVSLPQPTRAQANEPAPTVRYARGEEVGLADIVAEWRGYYADVPVYQCVCQADVCDQTDGWPYREYDRYQLSVALGPNNGKATESAGFNCFDIADGSRPTNPRRFSAAERDPNTPIAAAPPRIPAPPVPPAPPEPQPIQRTTSPQPSAAAVPPSGDVNSAPTAPVSPAQPVPAAVQPPSQPAPQPAAPTAVAAASAQPPVGGIPSASVINNGDAIQLDWPSGTSDVIAVANSNWNLNVLGAIDCESLGVVDAKLLEAQRVIGSPAVDSITGNIAVPVLLDSCVETDQSAVFIIDPNEGGGYALYRSQLPGEQTFPNEFSTYAFSSITGIQYWDGYLLVRQANAAGAEAIAVFLPGNSPAGEYAGCNVVRSGEGASILCKQ